MKTGWEVKKLGDVCDIVNGGTPDTKVKEYWDGKNLWITPKDMGKLNSIFVEETERKITDSGLKNSSAKLLPINSIILSSRAPIGYLAINKKPISTNQGCKGIIPKNVLDFLFLYYFLKKSVELLNGLGSGTTFKELSGSKLAEVIIHLPPLPEQKHIVAILDEAFESITKAKENAEKNLKNAKEIFESYLSEIFLNNDWEKTNLGKYNEVVVGYVGPISKEYTHNPEDVLLLSTKNVHFDGINLDKLTYVNKKFHDANKKSQLTPGDILVSRHGESGQAAVIPNEIKQAHALNVIVIKKSKDIDSKYIAYLLNSKILDKIHSSKKGSVQKIINTSIIKELIIPLPPIREQQELVKKLGILSQETKKLEAIYTQKLADLEELKKSILAKAFNGELTEASA